MLTKQIYKQTINDPIAFHKWILGNPIELSDGQKTVLRAVARYPETIIIAGSKSGKTTLSAEIALWGIYKMLQINPYDKYHITPGVKIYAMNVAPKEDIAVNLVMQMIKGLAYESWYLSEYIKQEKRNELEFEGNIVARAQGSSSRAGRGYFIFNLILDEFAAFMDTRGNLSGQQVLQAFTPRLAPFGEDGKLVAITTPQGRTGTAYDFFSLATPVRVLQRERTHGTLPFRAALQYATWELNPLPQYQKNSSFMINQRKKDPWMFDREFGGLFADVISAFLNTEHIKDCIDYNMKLPLTNKQNSYVVTGDPGLEHDNYAIAMGHCEGDNVVVDFATRFEPPLNIIKVEEFYEDLCNRYRVVDIVLDQHLSMGTIQRLKDKGLPARGVLFGAKSDVKIYQVLLELINLGKPYLRLPFYEPLIKELNFLQRITLADRYRVEAAPGSTDDLADAVALLTYVLKVERQSRGVVMF